MYTARMNLVDRLQTIRLRLAFAHRELQLEPEVFRSTAELALAGAEITEILELLEVRSGGKEDRPDVPDTGTLMLA